MPEYQGIEIYAVGKIEHKGWRNQLLPVFDDYDYSNDQTGVQWPWPANPIRDLPGAMYVGPHFLGDDHGCFHGENTHGVAAGDAACGGAYRGLTRPDVVKRCLMAIEQATHVFAWIDKGDAYGSLVELGYARALGKHIYLYLAEDLPEENDLWFATQVSSFAGRAKTAREAWEDLTLRLPGSRL
ncbi:hypothetical protein BS329_30470 [Amycolatopsis coloradensis]|uniref:Nucleoside 2-deoxyribosyltransferase n=2 Tax=Amycolatopsis coloradensis TaxID=76021 RepID=A0A1R0KKE0_9PSEU|nr:hypothetical protein BS329_30470 [Amycolatopsis coloradensis]